MSKVVETGRPVAQRHFGPSPAAQVIRLEHPFAIESGETIAEVELAFETWGRLNAARDNAILICPAFSASSHATSSDADPSKGWWEEMIGPGRLFDPDRSFVVCPSLLGTCFGSTGPVSPHPDGSGRVWGPEFPQTCVRDAVRGHLAVLDHLGIEQVDVAIGGSLGGMEIYELAVMAPKRVKKAVAISGTMRSRPYTAAIRHLGRKAIATDPAFRDGWYGPEGPALGLKLAREVGTLFYRSREELNQRFDWRPIRTPNRFGITFDVESYLDHQGNKAPGRFDANSYLNMSLAMDLHDLSRGRGSLVEACEVIEARVLTVGVPEDRLIPADEQVAAHEVLLCAGVDASYLELHSPIGHDTFLVEQLRLAEIIGDFVHDGNLKDTR